MCEQPCEQNAKKRAKPSYSLVGDLHGMQGGQRFKSAWLHLICLKEIREGINF